MVGADLLHGIALAINRPHGNRAPGGEVELLGLLFHRGDFQVIVPAGEVVLRFVDDPFDHIPHNRLASLGSGVLRDRPHRTDTRRTSGVRERVWACSRSVRVG